MRRVFASATWLPLGLRHAPGRIVLAAALGGLLGPLPAARAQSHPDQRQFQLRIQELKLQQAQQQLTQQQQFQQQQLQVQPAPLQQQQFQLQQLQQQQMQTEQIESLRLQVQQQNQIQRSLTNRGAVP